MEKQRTNRDIKNILVVLGMAIICAGLTASLFLYYYGSTGRYVAGHALLDPGVIERINYQEQLPKSSQNAHFIFEKTEFSYFDPEQGQVRRQTIPLEKYQKFYDLVSSEMSLASVSDNIKNLFLVSHPALLTTMMRSTSSGSSSTAQVFQVVQFLPEDYFRVQLHSEQDQGEWAYFYHSNLYKEIMRLFLQK